MKSSRLYFVCRNSFRHSFRNSPSNCNRRVFVAVLLVLLFLFGCYPLTRPKEEKLYLFILIGQSNMAGRGKINGSAGPPDPRILMLNQDQEWQVASHPLHFDKPIAGTGLGISFAKKILTVYPDIRIGLIPCAVGGSSIDQWQPGVLHESTGIYPYDEMLKRSQIASKDGELQAVLWHQGESDSKIALSETYQTKLYDFINGLRTTFGCPDLPFIAGELGPFYVQKNPNAQQINIALHNLQTELEHYKVVSAQGLTHKGDTTHFDSPSLIELGERYASAYLTLLNNSGKTL